MASIGLHGLIIVFLVGCVSASFPANEYEYSIRRQWLLDAEKKFEGGEVVLNQNETIVDHYLQYLKWAEFKKTQDRFLPFLPVNQTTIPEIMQTDVYKALEKLPKGGSMHTHENHEVSKSDILDMVFSSNDFKYLYTTGETGDTSTSWKLNFFTTPPDDSWTQVRGNYTQEDLLPHQTFLGILSDSAKSQPGNSALRWKEMNPLWGRATVLLDNIEIKKEYLKRLYEKNYNEGVQYLESRKAIGGSRIYKMDPTIDTDGGKNYLETWDNAGELEINITKEILADFMKEHPDFIGHKRITYATRIRDNEYIEKKMKHALKIHEKYPDHLIGFDLVGEEDAGNSHIFFLESFLSELFYDSAKGDTRMPLYQHTGETNWPKDLITSRNDADPVSTNENTYEAVLMGSRRVGHGLAYQKHPYLMKLLKEKDVAIEICPVSNQILGYVPDLRNHPAVQYIRGGLTVVLGTDDPGTFGVDHFTIDWYMAFMSWGLDLADMKKLSTNAIKSSGMSATEKADAMKKLNEAWVKYIKTTSAAACNYEYKEEPFLGRVFPLAGAKEGGTKVHIFGRNFEKAIKDICAGKGPKCRFGDKESHGIYVNNNHIVCEAPVLDTSTMDSTTVNVSVSLVEGDWLSTGQQFSYRYDKFTTTTTVGTTTSGNSGESVHSIQALSCLLVAVLAFLRHWNYFNM